MTTDALMNTYGTRSTTLIKGSGCQLWDDKGNRYLDALSGIAVCGLGHAHPAVSKAIADQAATLGHCSNYFNIPAQEQLAEKLRELSGMSNMFFGNSGAEANELAIKIARLYGHSKGIDLPSVVVMESAFHGRTLATLSATGNRKVQAGFEPLVRGFVRAPFNNLDALEAIAANNKDVCAILVEPVQGEGGIRIPDADYLQKLRAFCDRQGWLLMLDEIQTGNGRTGHYFAYQGAGILPDIVTTAKGLGNGVPIGVCMASGEAAQLLKPGNHGSTFGGNPLACAAALATVTTIADENLCARAAQLGQYIRQQLQSRLADCAQLKEIRSAGLMLAIELAKPCASLFEKALQEGLVINITAGNVIRLLPALTMSDAEADEMIDKLAALILDFQGDD